MRLPCLLLGFILTSNGFADEYALEVKTDLKAEYFVVARGGTPQQQIMLLKRVHPSGVTYSKRLFDCEARTYQRLGSWESLDAITADCPESEMRPIEEGTIADQLWQHACAEAETERTPQTATQSPQGPPQE